MSIDLSKAKVRVYDLHVESPTVAGTYINLGWVEDVQASQELTTRLLQPSQLHGQVVGELVLACSLTVSCVLREYTLANLARAFPAFSGTVGTDPIPVLPTPGTDLYASARKLILHPRDMDAALNPGDDGYDDSEDLSLLKAVVHNGLELAANGEEENGISLEFIALPDRSELPAIKIGYIGPFPA